MNISLSKGLGLLPLPRRSFSTASFLPSRTATVRGHDASFSILTHNVARKPDVLYEGPSATRDGLVSALATEILRVQPDVVVLCELFVDGAREALCEALRASYPYVIDAPDEQASFEEDSGLLLLSRWPLLGATSHRKFSFLDRDAEGNDAWANKGAIHARVQPNGMPCPVDLVFSHTQAVYGDGTGRRAHAAQLTKLRDVVANTRVPSAPCLLVGDLNFNGLDAPTYERAMGLLGQPFDHWILRSSERPTDPPGTWGGPWTRAFLAEDPGADWPFERLDYVLQYPGANWVLAEADVSTVDWTVEGRPLSDHKGLLARFHGLLEIRS